MDIVPRRITLVGQVQEILRQGMVAGRWKLFLPGERKLSRELQVSRWTLRAALMRLADAKLIQIAHGRPCRIVSGDDAVVRGKDWRVGCIIPEPLWQLRGFVALWIDALRAEIQDLGGHLNLDDGPRLFGHGCAKALTELTQQSPHDCWILLLSSQPMQKWFCDAGLSVIVAGSVSEGVDLPSIDLHHGAIARHAAGTLLAHGHRHIAFLSYHRGHAGVIRGERGFRAAFAEERYRNAELSVVYCEPDPASLCRALDRIFACSAPPTAFYIQQSNALLTTLGYLARRKMAVPRDISVIIEENEPYLRWLVPEQTCYSITPNLFAKQVSRLVRRALECPLPADTQVQLMPDFVSGKTVQRRA